MIPPICPQNVDNASPDAAEPTSSHTYRAPHFASLSTSFRSDLPPSGRSNSFNRSDPSPLDYEKTDEKHVSEFLWRSVCRCMSINDSLPKQVNFCEYTWEVVAYMMITGKGRSSSDMWPKTPNQSTGTKDIILTTWYKKAMKQTEINPQQHHLPGPSTKETCYASYTNSYLKNSYAYPVTDT